MKGMHNEFLNQLEASIDEKQNIIIGGEEFTPQQVLKDDPEAFNSAFDSWWNDKQKDYLEKAKEILKRYDNRERFESLQTRYNQKNVIPFVGAGLSIPSGYIGWTECLRKMREETNIQENLLEELIETGQYEEAAQIIHDAMRPNTFNEHINNKFGNDKTLAGCVCFLPYCFKGGVVTTNFDQVLERCYEIAENRFLEKLIGTDAMGLSSVLLPDKNVLVKLHGDASLSRNRIITKNEYEQHYDNNDGLNLLINDIAENTLLFLGCSLRIDRTVLCLKDLLQKNDADDSARHYTFAAMDNNRNKRFARRDELAKANIFPIWYPDDDDHDEHLMALLVQLEKNREIYVLEKKNERS